MSKVLAAVLYHKTIKRGVADNSDHLVSPLTTHTNPRKTFTKHPEVS